MKKEPRKKMTESEAKAKIKEIKLAIKRAACLTTLSFILGDVIETAMVEAEDYLDVIEKEFRYEDKHRLKVLLQGLRYVRKESQNFASVLYELSPKESDFVVKDSDWYYDLHKEMLLHVGESEEKADAVMQFVKGLPFTDKDLTSF